MTQRLVLLAYRDWAKEAAEEIEEYATPFWDVETITTHDIDVEQLKLARAQVVIALGWSWPIPTVPERITLIAHPSPLPRYRGGSPIQNQIIAGEKVSALTLFEATDQTDAGPIFWQQGYSLEGSLDEVLERIKGLSVEGSFAALQAIRGLRYVTVPQVGPTTLNNWPRRKPEQSEITPIMLTTMTGRQLGDFIRCQQPPYPQAFVRGNDGVMVLLDTRGYTREDLLPHGVDVPRGSNRVVLEGLAGQAWKRSADAAKERVQP